MNNELSNKLDFIRQNSDGLLIANGDDLPAPDSQVAMHSADPTVFNRIWGPLIPATADPADCAFSARARISADVQAIAIDFSRHIRHLASPHKAHDDSVFLLFARQGDVVLRLGGALHPLDVAIIGADTDFTVRSTHPGDVCAIGGVMLRGVPDIVARLGGDALFIAAGNPMRDMLHHAGERIIRRIDAPGKNIGTDSSGDVQRLATLIRSRQARDGLADQRMAAGHGGRDIVAAVQRCLREHVTDADMTPARIARHCAVSVRKLYNAFAEAGVSLRATVLSYRLEEARRQFQERSVKKVSTIAYDTGFRDVSTFYRNFRREFGFTPRHRNEAPFAGAPTPCAPADGAVVSYMRKQPEKQRIQVAAGCHLRTDDAG